MVINIIKFLKGYVKIRLSGYSPERFLNLCSHHHILIWNLENHGNEYEMCVSIQGFRQLKSIVKKTKTRLVILERHGLPFFLHKYRKRKGYFLGIGICVAIIYILSLFIWEIELAGNYSRTTDVILDFLKEEDVYHGIRKSKVDCEKIEAMIREEYDDIIWTSAEIRGTRLIINVKENTDLSLVAGNGDEVLNPSDLAADKPGIVTKIITRAGTPLVKEGDVVNKGDILISGRVDILNDYGDVQDYQYYAADGDVYLKTYYDYQNEFSLAYEDKQYTGNTKKMYYMKAFDEKLDLMIGKINYKSYDILMEDYPLKLGKNFYLPFSLGIGSIKEYFTTNKLYTEEEANELVKKHFTEFCEELIKKGVQIIGNDVKILIEEKSCKAEGRLQVIEKLGIRVPTEIITIPQEETEISP